MCLITMALNVHDNYPFILVANRDERYSRPSIGLHFWYDNPNLVAGRDLQAGGTWLGLTHDGRFAALTNHLFDSQLKTNDIRSRGELLTSYLASDISVAQFSKDLSGSRQHYEGYHLLYGDYKSLNQYSNANGKALKLTEGIYSLSNTDTDLSRFKVERSKSLVKDYVTSNHILGTHDLIQLFRDRKQASDMRDLPQDITVDLAQKNSSIFIAGDVFGTVSTTAILIDKNKQVSMQEVRYNQEQNVIEETKKTFKLD